MATLPRYQQMGIQYADLPRISTAGIEVGAKAMDVLGSQIDRMTNFVYEQGVTEAQRKAQQYAIENPPTKEQLQEAVSTGQFPRIEGAGRVFQQTYEKTQANLLSTELQLDVNKALTAISAAIDTDQTVDLKTIETELRDRIDGYTATIMALDTDQGLRFKAAATAAGNSIFQKAADRVVKVFQAENDAKFEAGVTEVKPVLEAIIATAGSVDPQTGQPIDIESLINVHRKIFLDSVRVVGSNKHLLSFEKAVVEAKQGALVGFMTDRSQVPDASTAIQRVARGDFGNLTPIYKGLTADQRQAVMNGVAASYSAEYAAIQQVKKLEEDRDKEAWVSLTLEYLRPDTSSARKRDIANKGVALKQITLQQAQDMLKPPGVTTDPVLYSQLNDQISRGLINSYQQLLPFKESLSDTHFMALSSAATNAQSRDALKSIRREAGIPDNPMYQPPKENLRKEDAILRFYHQELAVKVPNDQGVMVYQTPTQAAQKAIQRYDSGKAIEDAEKEQARIKGQIYKTFDSYKIPRPNILNIEDVDLRMIKNPDHREEVKKLLEDYKRNVAITEGLQ